MGAEEGDGECVVFYEVGLRGVGGMVSVTEGP